MEGEVLRIAVLGAGLQGACAALELAREGAQVDLYDQEPLPLRRASLRNEGKVHLGFVYAKDTSLRTARLMVEGALSFRPLLSRFVPAQAFALSEPFDYLVPRDTMVPPEALGRHFQAVEALYQAHLRDAPGADYLGARAPGLLAPLPASAYHDLGPPDRFIHAIRTEERAVDPVVLAEHLRAALSAAPGIRQRMEHRVDAVSREGTALRVHASAHGRAQTQDYDTVVNALWAGRLAIDRTMGLPAPAAWNHRLKLHLLCEGDSYAHPGRSFTSVLGAYGDVVQYASGQVYLSWYPACLKGWSDALSPPAAWRRYFGDGPEGPEACALGQAILDEAARDWMPGLAALRVIGVYGDVICGSGRQDITHQASGLHRRDEAGIHSVGRYHSVNTGKYTTAPLFAARLARRIARSQDTGGRDTGGPVETA